MKDPTQETYLDDDSYQAETGTDRTNRYRLIGLAGGVLVVFCCLAGLLAVWLGREPVIKVVAGLIASQTPTPTETLPPTATATFTLAAPTDTPPPPTDTPTPTLSPTPNRFPALDVMAIVTGPPVMKDDFADNSRNWIALGNGSDFIIQDGMLRLRNAQAGQPAGAYCTGDCGPYKDHYYYQAEVVEERPGSAGLGLLMAYDNIRNSGYVFVVRPSTAEYSLWKISSGSVAPLIKWTPSASVLPHPQPNLLGLAYQDGILTPYINGARQNGYKDNNPFKEGRVGFWVDPDGSPLLGGHASVFTLFPTTPTPPGMAPPPSATAAVPPTFTPAAGGFPTPTNPVPGAPTQPPPAGLASPTPPGPPPQPTATRPLISPTPTRTGGCPSYFPAGVWMLQIFKQSPGKSTAFIDGAKYTLQQGVNVYYLALDRTHTVDAGGKVKTYEIYNTCVIKYLTVK